MKTYDPIFFPYYASLTNIQKELYQYLYEKIKKGEKDISVSINCNEADLKATVNAIYLDRPNLFWMNSGYSYTTRNNIVSSVSINFNALASDIPKYSKQLIDVLNSYLEMVQGKSVLEQELFVHDSLANEITYKNGPYDQSVYSALVQKKSVCSGYTRAFQLIMQFLNIPCYYCHGDAKSSKDPVPGPHAWNILKLGNDYYALDLTWNDCYEMKNKISYEYFNCTDSFISKNHKRDKDSSCLPKCNGTKYTYKYITGIDPRLQQVYQDGVTYRTEVYDNKSFLSLVTKHMRGVKGNSTVFSFPVRGRMIIDNTSNLFAEAFRQVYGSQPGYSSNYSHRDYKNGYYRMEITYNVKY